MDANCRGLPMVRWDNSGHLVASQSLTREKGIEIVYREVERLAAVLGDKATMSSLRAAATRQRAEFTFTTTRTASVHSSGKS